MASSPAPRLSLLLLGLLVACGSQSAATKPETHAPFEAVLTAEAKLDEAAYRTANPNLPCPAACDAMASGCAASASICEIASAHDDSDLHARCEAARHGCARLQGDVRRCPCEVSR